MTATSRKVPTWDVGVVATRLHLQLNALDGWNENDHPRGQPGNAGQFGPGGASGGVHKGGSTHSTEGGSKSQELSDQVVSFTNGESHLANELADKGSVAFSQKHGMKEFNRIDKLLSAVQKAVVERRLKSDKTLYSGVTDPAAWDKIMKKVKVGKTFSPGRFLSTTPDRSVSELFQYSSNGQGGIIEIDAPKGTQALEVADVVDENYNTIGNLTTGDPHPDNPDSEHYLQEYITGVHQKYIVESIDKEKRTLKLKAIPAK